MRTRVGDINRFREIIAVIFHAGGGILLRRIRLGYLIPLRCRVRRLFQRPPTDRCLVTVEKGQNIVSPAVLRETLEKLGPSFIKLGQVLSLRADLVGEKFSNELSQLQSDVRPFPFSVAKQIVEKELGKPLESIFKVFEERPVAAASLAQVHRAFLENGDELAVKIQRPDIKKTIEEDIDILRYFAKLSERFLVEIRPYQPSRVVEEFADWTLRELDFTVEGANADRFRFMFRRNNSIKIPRIYWEFTTPRVLTMEFVHGVKANDLPAIEKLIIDRKRLALTGADAMFQQFLIDGFFHADPHPGNFFALENNVLCLHDFGMVGYLSQEQRNELIGCLIAFVNKDIDSFIKHIMHLAIVNNTSDSERFKKDITQVLNGLFFSTRGISFARIFFIVINSGARRMVSFPADLALFGKAILTSETMGLKLYPDFDFNEVLKPFIAKTRKTFLNPKKLFQALESDVFDYITMLRNLPEHLSNWSSRTDGPKTQNKKELG